MLWRGRREPSATLSLSQFISKAGAAGYLLMLSDGVKVIVAIAHTSHDGYVVVTILQSRHDGPRTEASHAERRMRGSYTMTRAISSMDV